MALKDKTLVCRNCGREFTFTVGEQQFYSSRGLLNEPTHCPKCRAAAELAMERIASWLADRVADRVVQALTAGFVKQFAAARRRKRRGSTLFRKAGLPGGNRGALSSQRRHTRIKIWAFFRVVNGLIPCQGRGTTGVRLINNPFPLIRGRGYRG